MLMPRFFETSSTLAYGLKVNVQPIRQDKPSLPVNDCLQRKSIPVGHQEIPRPDSSEASVADEEHTHQSVSPRLVSLCFLDGLQSSPRPRDDHGIADTSKCLGQTSASCWSTGKSKHLQYWEHLAFFFPVDQAMVVLHRDERGQVVGDGVRFAWRHSLASPCDPSRTG